MSRLDMCCSVDGCANAVWARGWCRKHYMRWYEHGDPTTVKLKISPAGAPRAFLEAIPSEGLGCIFWPYAKNNVGYGQVNVGSGRKVLVHRLVCERTNGPPPSDRHVAAHSCGQGHRGCCAPWHLSWKTPAENSADMVAHGTLSRGEDHPTAKLTEKDVAEIKQLLGRLTQDDIAARFGVSQRAISKIATGKTWRHLSASNAEQAA